MPIDPTLRDALAAATTACLARALRARGIEGCLVRGALPRGTTDTVVGEAWTLRLIPARGEAIPDGDALAAAVEAIPEGAVVVLAAGACGGGAALDEIVAARLHRRGVAGLVTDGAASATGTLAVWSGAEAPGFAPPLALAGTGEAVACGGAAIRPGDLVVADASGVVVIPADIAKAVALEAVERRRLHLWALSEVEKGAALPGLAPPDTDTLARYGAETRQG